MIPLPDFFLGHQLIWTDRTHDWPMNPTNQPAVASFETTGVGNNISCHWDFCDFYERFCAIQVTLVLSLLLWFLMVPSQWFSSMFLKCTHFHSPLQALHWLWYSYDIFNCSADSICHFSAGHQLLPLPLSWEDGPRFFHVTMSLFCPTKHSKNTRNYQAKQANVLYIKAIPDWGDIIWGAGDDDVA